MEIFIVVLAIFVAGYFFFRSKDKGSNVESLPEEFVVFDVETTGLNAAKDEIIEIAAIKVNKNSSNHAVFESLVVPKNKVTEKITKINGITQKLVEDEGRELGPVIAEFIEFIGDLRLVAFNSKFDMGFINNAATQNGLKINNQVSCALEMAKQAWPGLKSYKLTELARTAGVSTKGAHRALRDAELTVTVYATAVSILGRVQ